MPLKKMLYNVDWVFFGLLVVLVIFNLVVLKSASHSVYPNNPDYLVNKQLLWVGMGFVALVGLTLFDYHYWAKLAPFMYSGMILLLVGVLFAPERKGAHRWFDLGFMDLQPSELAKFVLIIAFAYLLYRYHDRLNTKLHLAISFAFVLLPMALILIEPDLGSSLVLFVIMLAMLWVGGVKPKTMFMILAILLLIIVFIFGVLYFATDGFQKAPEELPIPLPMEEYQLMRLIIFINPQMDPLGAGYHMIQSQVAIGSGGFWGKGYGQGSQVQGNFLPEHHTDFIFSVVGEEFGFAGSVFLVALYFAILARGVYIAFKAQDLLGSLIVTGVIAMLAFQIFINIGMTVGIMPITGIPLPFLSYGGSSMLMNMMCLGLVFSVNIRSRQIMFLGN